MAEVYRFKDTGGSRDTHETDTRTSQTGIGVLAVKYDVYIRTSFNSSNPRDSPLNPLCDEHGNHNPEMRKPWEVRVTKFHGQLPAFSVHSVMGATIENSFYEYSYLNHK